MQKTYLVAGLSTTLLGEIAEELAASGGRVMVAAESGKPVPFDEEIEKKIVSTDWTPRSPLSARNLLLTSLNRFDRLDELVYVQAPCEERRSLEELSAAGIEEAVDGAFKACLFVLKETAQLFQKHGGGCLSLVLHERPGAEASPLDGLVFGALKGLAARLFLRYSRGPLTARAFQSTVEPTREYAAFIAAALRDAGDKNRGRWTKFAGKGGFFAFGRR